MTKKPFYKKPIFIGSFIIVFILIFAIIGLQFTLITGTIPDNDLEGSINSLGLRNWGTCSDRTDLCSLNPISNVNSESFGFIEINDSKIDSVTIDVYSVINTYEYSSTFGTGLQKGSIKLSALNQETNTFDIIYAESASGFDILRTIVPLESKIINEDSGVQTIIDFGLTGKVLEDKEGSCEEFKFFEDDCITINQQCGSFGVRDGFNTQRTQQKMCLPKRIVLDNKYIKDNSRIDFKINLDLERLPNSDPSSGGGVVLSSVHVSEFTEIIEIQSIDNILENKTEDVIIVVQIDEPSILPAENINNDIATIESKNIEKSKATIEDQTIDDRNILQKIIDFFKNLFNRG